MGISQADLDSRREEMIEEFKAYRAQVNEGFDGIEEALEKGEYALACNLMNTISTHQGQASVNMRSVLVRFGFIVRERSGD